MQKIVINKRYGGFGLSPLATKRFLELKGKECYFYQQTKYKYGVYDLAGTDDEYTQISLEQARDAFTYHVVTRDLGDIVNNFQNDDYFLICSIKRDDPDLIRVVEELGEQANDDCSKLVIVEIPDNVKWYIDEHEGGSESIHEEHRSWS